MLVSREYHPKKNIAPHSCHWNWWSCSCWIPLPPVDYGWPCRKSRRTVGNGEISRQSKGPTPQMLPLPGNGRPYWGMMVVNEPLIIRPSFLGLWHGGGYFGDPLLEPLKKVAVGRSGQGSFNHREGVARTLGKINLQYHLNTILLQEPNILIIQVGCDTVDGRNPGPVEYPIIYRIVYIPGGFSRQISEPSTVWSRNETTQSLTPSTCTRCFGGSWASTWRRSVFQKIPR